MDETFTITAADVVTIPAEALTGCTGLRPYLLGCGCPYCQEHPAEGAVAVFTGHRVGEPEEGADTE